MTSRTYFFFLFSFFFAAQSISSGGIAHSAIRQLTGVPVYSRWYCKQCVLLRGTCAVRPWPSRGRSCGLLFENFNRFCAMQLFHTLQAWLPPHDLSATLFVFGEGPFYVTYSIFSSNNRCTIQSFLSSFFVVLHEHGWGGNNLLSALVTSASRIACGTSEAGTAHAKHCPCSGCMTGQTSGTLVPQLESICSIHTAASMGRYWKICEALFTVRTSTQTYSSEILFLEVYVHKLDTEYRNAHQMQSTTCSCSYRLLLKILWGTFDVVLHCFTISSEA